MDKSKQFLAKAALAYLDETRVLGIGTGSTVNYFIEQLATIKYRIDACVASSKATELLLRAAKLPVVDLNAVDSLAVYIDSADEINPQGMTVKGGGGALTREKIIATVADKFICLVDDFKLVEFLGDFPLAIEVIPMARSFVAREIVKLGGEPAYRAGFITDNGNIILDVNYLDLSGLGDIEDRINTIPGVVDNGLFAKRLADIVLIASKQGNVQEIILATRA